ncbi:AAA family ATPase, partial [Acinetobacter baumannii]
MGVAGCGKSTVAARAAQRLGLPLVEGDDFHSPASVAKMRAGEPLTDADRAGWLARLADELAARPAGAVLSCSALKRAYRDRLRAASP